MHLDYKENIVKISFSNELPFISAEGDVIDASSCHGLVSFHKKRGIREGIHGLIWGAEKQFSGRGTVHYPLYCFPNRVTCKTLRTCFSELNSGHSC